MPSIPTSGAASPTYSSLGAMARSPSNRPGQMPDVCVTTPPTKSSPIPASQNPVSAPLLGDLYGSETRACSPQTGLDITDSEKPSFTSRPYCLCVKGAEVRHRHTNRTSGASGRRQEANDSTLQCPPSISCFRAIPSRRISPACGRPLRNQASEVLGNGSVPP